MTRTTRIHVWLRWEAYGHTRRGLSTRFTWAEFKAHYLPAPNPSGYPDNQRWFRRAAMENRDSAQNIETTTDCKSHGPS